MKPQDVAERWAGHLAWIGALDLEAELERRLFHLRELYAGGRIDVRRLELETEGALLRYFAAGGQ